MNRKYNKGRNLEYEIKDELEKLGYVVLRSAGSKGNWDLVGIKKDLTVLFQAKMHKESNGQIFLTLLKTPPSSQYLRKIYVFKEDKELKAIILIEDKLVEGKFENIILRIEEESENFKKFFENLLTKKYFCGKIELSRKTKKKIKQESEVGRK